MFSIQISKDILNWENLRNVNVCIRTISLSLLLYGRKTNKSFITTATLAAATTTTRTRKYSCKVFLLRKNIAHKLFMRTYHISARYSNGIVYLFREKKNGNLCKITRKQACEHQRKYQPSLPAFRSITKSYLNNKWQRNSPTTVFP